MYICVDPGHGGHDPGAVSKCGRYQEKSNVLAVAKEIHARKGDLPGVDFIFTRLEDKHFSTNQYADLQARCDIANSAGADLFISIHQNGDAKYQGRGIETFSLAETGEGRKLAEAIHRQLVKKAGLIDRGLKTANWHVLRETHMPAVLVECGFIGGDPEEAEYVSRLEAVKIFADCILRGVADYLNIKLEDENMSEFKDLNKCWYPELALEAVKLGLVGGIKRKDGLYLAPQEPLTREQGWIVDLRQHKILDHIMDIPGMVEKYMPSIVRIWSKSGSSQTVGSGSFIAPSIILTNAHVIGNNSTVSVDTHDFHPDNNKMQGKVIKKDTYIDLALVKIEREYTPLKLSNGAVHGEFCLVLGNPGGEWQSVTLGIVAHPDRGDYIETDARINPGNSGGAVLNERGELIGVPSHKITMPGFDNQNYAIRVSKVKDFIKGVI